MPSLHRFPPYVIAAAVLFMITFYHVYNVRSKNSDLERNVKIFKEALAVSKEKNKVLVKDAMEKIEKKDARIQQLEQENLAKHTKLGETQSKLAKIKSNLKSNKDEIEKLNQLAAGHQAEISTLTKSVSKSKKVLTELAAKADHLMLDHKKLKKENTELQQQNEKLQNDIKRQQSERRTLDEQISTLEKEKEDLGIKVDDLTRKNEVIQESIKQKIKESYAARREMILAQRMKETEDRRPRLGTLQDLTHRPVNVGQTDSSVPKSLVKSSEEDQVPKAIVDNSDKNPNNLSKIMVDSIDNQNAVSKMMVDNSDTGNESKTFADDSDSRDISRIMVNNSDDTQNNVSRIIVDNHAVNREKRDAISFVAKNPTAAKNNLIDGEESLNDVRSRPSDSLDDNTPQGESRISLPGFQSKTPEKASENVEQEKNEGENFENRNMDRQSLSENKDENFEAQDENGNTKRGSLSEGNDEENVHEMRTGSDTMPVFPNIQDETINRQSSNVYGGHLQDGSKHNAESFDQTDS